MREVYILIHEYEIDSAMGAPGFPAFRATPAANEIRKLRQSGAEIIPNSRSRYSIPDELPPPAGDLVVKVIGAFRGECVDAQYQALIDAHYNAEIHEKGCVPCV